MMGEQDSTPLVANVALELESASRHRVEHVDGALYVIRVNGQRVAWEWSLSRALGHEAIVKRALRAAGVNVIAGVLRT